MKFKVHVEHGDSDCTDMTCEAFRWEDLVIPWEGLVWIGDSKQVIVLPKDKLRSVRFSAVEESEHVD